MSNSPTPEPVNIAPEDLGRQAVRSLGGYLYQLYQTLNAWLRISPDDTLYLEVAEDYMVLIDNVIKQVQVKDTKGSGNVNLRSKGVRSLIESHLRLQQMNPSRCDHPRILAQSQSRFLAQIGG